MQIGFDIRFAQLDATGVGTYVHELAHALGRFSNHQFYFFAYSHPSLPELTRADNCHLVSATSGKSYGLWTQTTLVKLIKKTPIEIFHSPLTSFPLRLKVPLVVTLHDLIWLHRPEEYGWLERKKQSLWLQLALKKAAGLVMVSEKTQADLRAYQGTSIPKAVTHLGVANEFVATQANWPRTSDFFISIGGASRPRKRFDLTIEALRTLNQRNKTNFRLKVTGPIHPFFASSIQAYSEFIECTGNLSRQELVGLLQQAQALVFLSPQEGFAMPIAEALASFTPVIALTSIPAVREIFAPAVYSLEQPSPEEFYHSYQKMQADPQQCYEKTRMGWQLAGQLSWNNTANKTLQLYQKILAGSKDNES